MKEAIRARALESGFDVCRFTTAEPPESSGRFQDWIEAGRDGEMTYLKRNQHKRIDPRQVLPDAKSIICLAAGYHSSPKDVPAVQVSSIPDGCFTGMIARYARYADYHDVLGERLKTLSDFTTRLGGERTRSLWYVDTGPLLERDFAQRAGVGFVGKHTNLISRQSGNWILLAEILTTLELDPDPSEKNRCGSCVRCLDACPTRAITAPFQLDARLCISYLTIELKGSIPVELRPAIGDRIFGCDDCLAVCPWNRFAREGRLMRDHTRDELGRPDLVELLRLDEDGFRRRFAGTPMLRAKRRGLLRNVCVALGNVGDDRALPALERAAGDVEPLIAEHALWAVSRITSRMRDGKLHHQTAV